MPPKPLRSAEERRAEFEAWCLLYPEDAKRERRKMEAIRERYKPPPEPEPDPMITRKQAEAAILAALKHSKPFRQGS